MEVEFKREFTTAMDVSRLKEAKENLLQHILSAVYDVNSRIQEMHTVQQARRKQRQLEEQQRQASLESSNTKNDIKVMLKPEDERVLISFFDISNMEEENTGAMDTGAYIQSLEESIQKMMSDLNHYKDIIDKMEQEVEVKKQMDDMDELERSAQQTYREQNEKLSIEKAELLEKLAELERMQSKENSELGDRTPDDSEMENNIDSGRPPKYNDDISRIKGRRGSNAFTRRDGAYGLGQGRNRRHAAVTNNNNNNQNSAITGGSTTTNGINGGSTTTNGTNGINGTNGTNGFGGASGSSGLSSPVAPLPSSGGDFSPVPRGNQRKTSGGNSNQPRSGRESSQSNITTKLQDNARSSSKLSNISTGSHNTNGSSTNINRTKGSTNNQSNDHVQNGRSTNDNTGRRGNYRTSSPHVETREKSVQTGEFETVGDYTPEYHHKDGFGGLRTPVDFQSRAGSAQNGGRISVKSPNKRRAMGEAPKNDKLAAIFGKHVRFRRDGQPRTLPWLLNLINKVYEIIEKQNLVMFTVTPSADSNSSRPETTNGTPVTNSNLNQNGNVRPPFAYSLFDYLKQQYGTQELVDQYAGSLMATLIRYRKADKRVEIFAKFVEEEWDLTVLDMYMKFFLLLRDFKPEKCPEYYVGQSKSTEDVVNTPVHYSKVRIVALLKQITNMPAFMEALYAQIESLYHDVPEEEFAKGLKNASIKYVSNQWDAMEALGMDDREARRAVYKGDLLEVVCKIAIAQSESMRALSTQEESEDNT
jgi:hypothetical protein